jgi:F-type H+-transporting ATPase subunit b
VKLLRLLPLLSLLSTFATFGAVSLPAPALAGEEEEAARHAPGDVQRAANEAEGEGHGEGHEAPSLDFSRLGSQLFNFAALIAILYFGGRKAVSAALQSRHTQIKTDLASAAEARTAAQARFEKQEQRLAALEQEIAAIAASIKQEAEVEKQRLIAMAEERAKRIREESEFIIEQQIKQAEEDLRREVAAAAVALAEKIVRTQMMPGDQQRMIDAFVGDIATPNGAHPGTPPSGSGSPAARGAPRSEI